MTLTVQSAFRLPAELVERVDAFAARLQGQHQFEVTRTDAVRILLRAGLEAFEQTTAATTKPAKTKGKKK